jgi:hypothetical protein
LLFAACDLICSDLPGPGDLDLGWGLQLQLRRGRAVEKSDESDVNLPQLSKKVVACCILIPFPPCFFVAFLDVSQSPKKDSSKKHGFFTSEQSKQHMAFFYDVLCCSIFL